MEKGKEQRMSNFSMPIKWQALDWQRPFEVKDVWELLSHLATLSPHYPLIWEVRSTGGQVRYQIGTRAPHLEKPKTLAQIESIWYEGYRGRRSQHYHDSRYHFLNLHSFFHGNHTVELRGFNGTLHAGKIRAHQRRHRRLRR